MEKNEQMDTHEAEEDREKKRKLQEGKDGKMRCNGSTPKIRRKMESYSRKADEMLEKFLQITSSVGNQIKGMNSIVKMKEEGDDKYTQVNERITNMKAKSWTWMKNMNTEVKPAKENILVKIKENCDNRIPQ